MAALPTGLHMEASLVIHFNTQTLTSLPLSDFLKGTGKDADTAFTSLGRKVGPTLVAPFDRSENWTQNGEGWPTVLHLTQGHIHTGKQGNLRSSLVAKQPPTSFYKTPRTYINHFGI